MLHAHDKRAVLFDKSFQRLGSDPRNNLTNALSKLGTDGRSGNPNCCSSCRRRMARRRAKACWKKFLVHKSSTSWWNPLVWFGAFSKIGVRGAEELKENMDTSVRD